MNDLRTRSGEVTSEDPLVTFLYILMRDHLPAGVVEEIVERHTYHEDMKYTNGWLAEYAKDLAARLKKP